MIDPRRWPEHTRHTAVHYAISVALIVALIGFALRGL
ncbi:MAG: hypothetical protein ACJA1L_001771 [Paracoccaceae bacterium]|jgi:hypothetical protein